MYYVNIVNKVFKNLTVQLLPPQKGQWVIWWKTTDSVIDSMSLRILRMCSSTVGSFASSLFSGKWTRKSFSRYYFGKTELLVCFRVEPRTEGTFLYEDLLTKEQRCGTRRWWSLPTLLIFANVVLIRVALKT